MKQSYRLAGERFASLPGRLLATASALVITFALLLLPLADAVAGPMLSVSYDTGSSSLDAGFAEESGLSGSSNICIRIAGNPSCAPPPGPEFTLPQFNPALGILDSVDFTGTIFLTGDVQASCNYPFKCDSSASLYAEATINLDDVKTSGGNVINNFGPSLSLSIGDSVSCSGSGVFQSATCFADSGAFSNSASADRTFTGASVAPFVGLGQIQFDYSQSPFNPSYEWGLSQSDSLDDFLYGAHSGGTGILENLDTGDNVVGALGAIYELFVEDGPSDSGCCQGYGAVNIQRSLEITYNYEPASASVPEPATLALFGLGLAGIGLTRRALRAR